MIILLILLSSIDSRYVFYGTQDNYTTVAEINYTKVIRSTEEYEYVRTHNLSRNSAKYWLLLNKAADRITRALSATNYDLIVERGKAPGPVVDITKEVINECASPS